MGWRIEAISRNGIHRVNCGVAFAAAKHQIPPHSRREREKKGAGANEEEILRE